MATHRITSQPAVEPLRPRGITVGCNHWLAGLLLAWAGTAPLQGQTTQPTPKPQQEAPQPTRVLEGEEARERAREVLEGAAKRHQRIQTLQGQFTQEVHTPLLKKPLRSKGSFVFQKQPACVVFSIQEPEPTVCRFDELSYQVYRPKSARAERFLFGKGEVGKSLVRVFSPNPDLVSQEINVASVRETGDQTTLALRPKDAALKNFLVDLEVTLDTKAGYITALSYTNAEGDRTVLQFARVQSNKTIPAERFARTLPKGTDIKLTELKE